MRAGKRDGGKRGADLLAADLHDVLVAGVGGLGFGPHGEELRGTGIEGGFALGDEAVDLFDDVIPADAGIQSLCLGLNVAGSPLSRG
jgi:hypothetical protein